jgi:hypothetical protein
MTNREFNKTLKGISNKEGILDAEKIKALPNETKNKLVNYLVTKREPIVKDFINSDTDVSWLSCMGYMYPAKGKVFEFLCTCENMNKIKA